MVDVVKFFEEDVLCQHCGGETQGEVFECSGIVLCHICDRALLDCSDIGDGAAVVLVQLENVGEIH